ncbi:MAG: hypothetical protein HY821_07670 [Acidobacteria bacterium]|nr:hypothetical protein [Acidobacteriota bacterium]
MSLRTILFLLAASVAWAAEGETAGKLYKDARKALEKGDYTQAYLLSAQAVALDPKTPEYWQFSQAVRTRGLAGVKVETAVVEAESGGSGAPGISKEDLEEARRTMPPPMLHGGGGRKSFHFRGDAKKLFEEVAKAYGLDVVFDADYQAGQPLTFNLENADWQEAVRAAESVTSSFLVALSDRVALVAKDTAQKRTELERVMTVLVPFAEPLSPQEMQEAARAVQSSFDMTKMGIDNARKVVLFRDRVSRLKPALDLFQQLMVHRAQVMTEVELLVVNRDSTLSYGARFQSTFPFYWVGGPVVNPLNIVSPLPSLPLAVFGGGSSAFGVVLTGNSFFASLTQGQVQSAVKSQILGVDGQAAQLHLGDKYPVMTAGYYGRGGQSTGTGKAYVGAPTVNFEDLGIVLKVTPRVHNMSELSMEVEAEFKTLTGQATNGIPVIANRKFSTRVRTSFEQTTIIAGLVQDTISQSWSSLPGLQNIPWLRANSKSGEHSELLLTLKPRLVSLPPSEIPTVAVRTGSETRPLTPLN